MSRGAAFVLLSMLVLMAAACGGGGGSGRRNAIGSLDAPPTSSPIALTRDGSLLVAANADGATVALLSQVEGDLSLVAEVAVGADPRSVAIDRSDARAFVACAADDRVDVVDLATRTRVASFPVGTEPDALLLSPNGTRGWVAAAVSGTLTVFDPATLAIEATLTLSPDVVREPCALAITDDGDGDDDDETLCVAGCFAATRAGRTGADEGQDDQREGRVALLSAATGALLATVPLAPLPEPAFPTNGSTLDRVGTIGGAGGIDATEPANPPIVAHVPSLFPNQLAALAIHPTNRICYVASVGTSPDGPAAHDGNVHGLVSLVNLVVRNEIVLPALSPVVHQRAPLDLDLGSDLVPPPAIALPQPSAIAWRRDGSEAWLAVAASDVIVRMTVDSLGVPTIGAPRVAGASQMRRIDLRSIAAPMAPCSCPHGIALDRTGARAFVLGRTSFTVASIDLATDTVVDVERTTPAPPPGSAEEAARLGGELFRTGRVALDRMAHDSAGACAVCHPDGLSDHVTWMTDDGPRQTPPLDSLRSEVAGDRPRLLGWSATRDETHDFELQARRLLGARGLVDDDRIVFLFGGAAGGSDRAEGEAFHSFTGEVSLANELAGKQALPPLPSARRDFGAATLPDGRLLIAGGRAGAGDGTLLSGAGSVVLFDPRANAVTPLSDTGFTPRHSLMVAALATPQGAKVIAAGGYDTTDPAAAPVATVEEYDVATDAWSAVASMPVATAQAAIAALAPLNEGEPWARADVVGGNLGSLQLPLVTGAVHVWSTASAPGSWSTLPFSLLPRRELQAAAIVRGDAPHHVLAFGGRDASGNVVTTVDGYAATLSQDAPVDPVAPIASALTPLPFPLADAGIAVANDHVLLFGGVDASGNELATLLEYDPSANPPSGSAGAPGVPSGLFVERGPLTAPRRGVAASSPPPLHPLLPAISAGRDSRLDALATWVERAVRTRSASSAPSGTIVAEGRDLFAFVGLTGVPGVSCVTCHGGPRWTRSTRDWDGPPTPALAAGPQAIHEAELVATASQPGTLPQNGVLVDVGTFDPASLNEVRLDAADVSVRLPARGDRGFNVPSLLGVGATAPYLHDGRAATLAQVLDGSLPLHGTSPMRFVHHVVDPNERLALLAFLGTIDGDTSPFP